MNSARYPLLILLIALLYGLGHFTWYVGTPLGLTPVLDERENILLAAQIAGHALPPEPFYRAMGYPLLLAGVLQAGLPEIELPVAALLLGLILHGLGAMLVAKLAQRWFNEPRAGLLAGLLFALNPVLVHFATQRLDATLSLVLFLAGLFSLDLDRNPPGRRALFLTSLWWSLAALTRPQFLTVWLMLPVLALWRQPNRRGGQAALATLACGGFFFIAQGFWQRSVCGEFRILPWQGAYNLWAANAPDTHGRYYHQTLDLSQVQGVENPARVESLLLYQTETDRGSTAIDVMNAHWRRKFVLHVATHPLRWLGLMTRKTYALLNNWEQYNNKTYALHKARSPWLRPNPIGWGLLLLLGVVGAWRLQGLSTRQFRETALIAVACAGGIVLFYVSARFRLPLAALLCVLAGGALARPFFWRSLTAARQCAFAALILCAGLVTFSAFDHVRDARPYLQDHLLMARAAQEVGDDGETWREAQAALALEAGNRTATEFIVTSGFNRQLTGSLAPTENVHWRESMQRLLDYPAAPNSKPARLIAAVMLHDTAALRATTQQETAAAYDALGGLALIDAATTDELLRLRAAPLSSGTTLFLMARQQLNPAEFSSWAGLEHTPAWALALATARTHLLGAR